MSVDRQRLRAAFAAVLQGRELTSGAVRSSLRTASAREVAPRALGAPAPAADLDVELVQAAIRRARTWLTDYLRRFEALAGVRYERVERLVELLDRLERREVSGFEVARALREIRAEGLDIDPAATAICHELPDLDERDRGRLLARLDEAAQRGDPSVAALTGLLETVVDVLTEEPATQDLDPADSDAPVEAESAEVSS